MCFRTYHLNSTRAIQFEISLCPALQHKPTLPTPHFGVDETVKKTLDPFAPPYIPNLYLGELKDEIDEEEYVLLVSKKVIFLRVRMDIDRATKLNKYSVVPNHFLLVTKGVALCGCCWHPNHTSFTEFQSQSTPLFPCDLVQAYLLLDAARKAGYNMLAFYNCASATSRTYFMCEEIR